ncbi:hypothetical protein Tco_0889850 [Tanacetum coccineum]
MLKKTLNNQQPKLTIPPATTIVPSVITTTTTQMQSPPQYPQKGIENFDFVTESGEHIHLTKEQISAQKKIEEEAKAEDARREGEIKKEELIGLLGPEVGSVTLKVYREDDTSKIIPEFKASDLLWISANKMIKSLVQYEDHRTMLNEPVLEIFFRLHQGPGLDDHARTFSSLLLAEIDKRNLIPLKQMRVIE